MLSIAGLPVQSLASPCHSVLEQDAKPKIVLPDLGRKVQPNNRLNAGSKHFP